MDFKCHTLACGFAHSCVISTDGRFYVWGENLDGRIQALAYDKKRGKTDYVNTMLALPNNTQIALKNNARAEDGEEIDEEDLEE
jgi:alpha-tubulin suppressor-like RCC1 family protein